MKKYMFGKQKFTFIFTLVSILIQDILVIYVAMWLNNIIDDVQSSIMTGQDLDIYRIVIISILYAAVIGLFIFLAKYFKAKHLKNINTYMKRDLMHSYLSNSEDTAPDSGKIVQTFGADISFIETNYIESFFKIYNSIVMIITALILLLFLNPILAIISIVLMLMPTAIPKIFGEKIALLGNDISKKGEEYNQKLTDIADGIYDIQIYDGSNFFEDTHNRKLNSLESGKLKLNITIGILSSLSTSASIIAQFIIMAIAGLFAAKGLCGIGSLVAVTQLAGQVISPMTEVPSILSQIKSSKSVIDKVIGEINSNESTDNKTSGFKSNACNKGNNDGTITDNNIRIKNLSFSYSDKDIINDISIDFESGKKYALIGESGCGKSTLLKLIAGRLKNYSGFISENDSILLSQSPHIFNESIRDNITLSKNSSDDNLTDIISKTNLEKVLAKQEDNLDTIAGTNGSKFSGGERQRISIARALFHKKNVLLLDEITSALDFENAYDIEKEITNLDATVISIMHTSDKRILNLYDEVITIDNGQITNIKAKNPA